MIIEYKGKRPQIHPGAFIAPTATLIGDVTVEEGRQHLVWRCVTGRLRKNHGGPGQLCPG
jgi:carbonic anhydrase/acetyltransferase-like protein (isoleucine patch superfamily)